MVAILAYAGVSEGDAFILSLLLGISILIASLPGGLIWIKGGYKPVSYTHLTLPTIYSV